MSSRLSGSKRLYAVYMTCAMARNRNGGSELAGNIDSLYFV